jgi:hypothetical protein
MSDRHDFEQQSRVLSATYDFVEWANGSDIPPGYRYEVDAPGKRFVRIVMVPNGGGRSVHAFVDLTTGDLLKAAGWKAPAKGPRGNLLTDLSGAKARFDWSGHYLYKR